MFGFVFLTSSSYLCGANDSIHPYIINKEEAMVSIDGLAVEFSGTTLFSDISFVINEKDRIALMG